MEALEGFAKAALALVDAIAKAASAADVPLAIPPQETTASVPVRQRVYLLETIAACCSSQRISQIRILSFAWQQTTAWTMEATLCSPQRMSQLRILSFAGQQTKTCYEDLKTWKALDFTILKVVRLRF